MSKRKAGADEALALPDATLGAVSAAAVDAVLSRANAKRGRNAAPAARHAALPAPRASLAATALGACGAPAQSRAGIEAEGQLPASDEERGGEDDGAGAGLEEEEDAWEDAPEATPPPPPPAVPVAPAAAAPAAVVIDFDDDADAEANKSAAKKPRKAPAQRRATAADRAFAELVHRAHVLCLAARALAFDAAADDAEVAALALSALPQEAHPPPPAQRMAGLDREHLASLVAWFGGMVTLQAPPAPGAAPRGGAPAAAPGAAGAVAALRSALSRHAGTAEELSALFVAVCRALAVPARTAHALFPAPLKPDGASLEASQGLTGTDPAGWHRYRYGSRREGAQAMLRAARRAPRVAPPVAAPRQRAPKQTPAPKASPAPAIATAAADVVDLTGDSDGGGDADFSPSVAPPPPKRRRDDELERDTAAALRASLADAAPPADGGGAGGARGDGGAQAWSRRSGPVRHWAEVYCGAPPGGAWLPVLPWERAALGVDCGARCEAGALAGAPGGADAALPYVLACAGGGAKDVTARYAQRWSAAQKARADAAWWAEALQPLRAAAADGAGRGAAAAEDAALAAAQASEAMPRRVADFKAHPLYCLERHLTRYQGLHPAHAAVGALGAEPVFPRAAVATLHTAAVWEREHGRRVLAQCRDAPAKRVPRRGAAAAAKRAAEARAEADREAVAAGLGGGGEANEEEEDGGAGAGGPTVALYGEWQTEAHAPEAAEGGRVPVNSFGNVDLTHGAAPPAGCVHVDLPRAAACARALGIHAPPALTGFERYAGRQVPVLQGVVVAEEHAGALRDACLADERAREERALQRATDEAAKRWRKLLAAVWVRRRVNAEYGGGGGAAARAPAAPRAAAAVEVMELDSDGEVVHAAQQPHAAPAAGGSAQRLASNGVAADVEQM